MPVLTLTFSVCSAFLSSFSLPAKANPSALSGGTQGSLFPVGSFHLHEERLLHGGIAAVKHVNIASGNKNSRIANVCVCVWFLSQELLSQCGADLSCALPWPELHMLNFSYNSIVCLDRSLVRQTHGEMHLYLIYRHVTSSAPTVSSVEFTERPEISGFKP